MSLPRIALAQLGARRHYQQPSLLYQWGMLHTLYTDLYIDDNWTSKTLRHPKVISLLPAGFKRMLDRYEPSLANANIVQFPQLGIQYSINRQFSRQDLTKTFIDAGKDFNNKIIRYGLGDATKIYGFNSACLEVFEFAKLKGVSCILDQTLAERSYCYKLIQAEEARWPGWSIKPFKLTSVEERLAYREQREQDLADQIICGSSFVKDSLIARQIPAEKITVVPLGRTKQTFQFSSHQLFEDGAKSVWKNRSDGLHILFAGAVGLRKGIPYLLEALHQLKGEIPFTCKAAGSIQITSKSLEKYQDICQFLGRVPRSAMKDLYKWADVFVLPSLCEGSAMVTYEALKYGVPVITTYNTGSIIRNGLGGQIVPIQNTNAIANAILELFERGVSYNFTQKALTHQKQVQTEALSIFKSVLENSGVG